MITKHDGITVTEFVKQLKNIIDHHPSFNNVTLIGELSNFKAHQSGHFYFTLKDEGSRINCVMFRSHSQKVLFKPKDGDKVLVTGNVEVYEAAGSIQMYASRMNLDGLGDLHIRYEALKQDFRIKGYFDLNHKKKIPVFPNRIAVIVGSNSAAYHDIAKTLQSRWPLAHIDYAFATVQGKEAILSVKSNLERLDSLGYDVIIIARGGGSIEDLWAFNEEVVVEAVFNANTPIISGIGHESDTTLIDYVADLRAATPTAAAVAATPDKVEVSNQIRNFKNQFYMRVKNSLQKEQRRHKELIMDSKLSDPVLYMERQQMKLDLLQSRVLRQTQHFIGPKKHIIEITQTMMRLLDMRIHGESLKIQRGSANLDSVMNLKVQRERLRLSNRNDLILQHANTLIANIGHMRVNQERMVNGYQKSLGHHVTLKKRATIDIMRRISTHNPLEKMASIYERGFAQLSHDGMTINTIEQVDVGMNVTLKLKDGHADATIIRKGLDDGKI